MRRLRVITACWIEWYVCCSYKTHFFCVVYTILCGLLLLLRAMIWMLQGESYQELWIDLKWYDHDNLYSSPKCLVCSFWWNTCCLLAGHDEFVCSQVFETRSSRRMFTLVASFVVIFLIIYYLTRWKTYGGCDTAASFLLELGRLFHLFLLHVRYSDLREFV